MVSRENTNWILEFGLIEDIPVPDSTFNWAPQPFNPSSNVGVEIDGTLGDSGGFKESGSKKRGRSEACTASSSKACREKLRRDRLNDKFIELGSILEPGRPPKTDKTAILIDAVNMVTQLRGEAQKLKDSNMGLQDKIKDLKAEKNELRDEKQRLKAEKERLEQQLMSMNAQPSFLPPPAAIPATIPATFSAQGQAAFAAQGQAAFAAQGQAAFAAQGQAAGNKLVPFISYPGVAMWQFMPPASVDTSQDHVLRPPVA
ncbi:hypothetical protein Lal_00019699 [Lupinus albus]|uniref:Putative transcription factor bHLH family n=1 Tax=Lupinus albus TaxID=3870 RepID=A0A6A4R1T5_LUPAL|nr:putative transcription factor bHLH family [Lupinus albus]KAF1899571.1 hypothetical protein Lal_00019699 [Lupinus albus]